MRVTRDERFKNAKESKVNFWDKLKELSTTSSRRKEGRLNVLAQLSAEAERLRLSEPTVYLDGSIDRPLLIPELLDEEEDNE